MVLGLLKGLTVLITRPREQSETAAAYMAEQGASPLILPTLEIIPIDPEGGWARVFEALSTADIAVFTSANAVRQIMAQDASRAIKCAIAAIGTATQKALEASRVSCDWVPMRDYRSEGLLELPVFQNVVGKKIILLGGEGGRDYLEDVLSERGADVEKLALYRRERPDIDETVLTSFFNRKGPKVILSTSMASLSNLLVLSAPIGDPREVPLLVISERMTGAAKALGFGVVVTAENASDEAVVRALVAWR